MKSYAEVAKDAAQDVSKDVNSFESSIENDASRAGKKADEASSNIKSKAQAAAGKASAKAKEYSGDIKKAEKDAADKIKNEYNEHKGPVIDFFNAVFAKLQGAASYVVNTSSSATSKASQELKNPVVATQAVVTVGAIAGLVVGIQERAKIFRFKSDGEITAILAGLVGLVALDGVLFNKYYSKYDKKNLK